MITRRVYKRRATKIAAKMGQTSSVVVSWYARDSEARPGSPGAGSDAIVETVPDISSREVHLLIPSADSYASIGKVGDMS